MTQFFLRTLLAVIVYLAFFALLGPVLHLMGFGLSPDLFTILHVVLGIVALGYIIWGPPVPKPW
jgi:hypothetical protein